MRYELIQSDEQLLELCARWANAPIIAYDTEFISEDTYRPQLCLIQAGAGGHLALIDPLSVGDLTPFWELLTREGHETVVHAGREEFLFCLRSIGRRPTGFLDVQVAAGLVGLDYPAGYGNLVSRVLGRSVPKGETRTNWRARPLSPRQLHYAAADVAHLQSLRDALGREVQRLGREDWLAEEMQSWQDALQEASGQRSWQRLPGINRLDGRGRAIAREVWNWREASAARRNRPARQVLRDDLIIELARRASPDAKGIRALRGMEHRHLAQALPEISRAIERGLASPEEDGTPPAGNNDHSQALNLLGQFVSTALAGICREKSLAPALVANAADIKDLLAYHLRIPREIGREAPALMKGWRGEVVGQRVQELLEGRLALRIGDPRADNPLVFECPEECDKGK